MRRLRGHAKLLPTHAAEAVRAHEPSDPMAPARDPVVAQRVVDHRRAVSLATRRVLRPNGDEQLLIRACTPAERGSLARLDENRV
jgi:hypothetical protein